VRGTNWLIADYTDHTLVTVRKGIVAVQNLTTKKTKLITAGHSIIVNPKARGTSGKKPKVKKPKKKVTKKK
jgi:ferric-dicitrate binding protein FerR (iron transport regulator)